MPDTLQSIIERMVEGGESEEDIAGVIQQYKPSQNTPQEAPPQEEPKSLWDRATSPLTNAPTRFSESISNYINPNRETKGIRGVGSAFIEGLGGAVSGLTSPLNLATAGMGLGETTAAKYGLPQVAKALNIGQRAASVPQIAEGIQHTANAESLPEGLSGLLETGLGAHGSGRDILSGARAAKPYVGKALEFGGGVLKKRQSLYTTARRTAGDVIENFGNKLQETSKGEVKLPEVKNAEIVKPKSPTKPPDKPTPGMGGGKMSMGPALNASDIKPVASHEIKSSPASRQSRMQMDSRISGLPPQMPTELPLRNGPPSAAVNRYAEGTGPNLIDELRHQANKFGMSIEDYIASLRRGGGENFVMPSANLPRVR